MDKTPNEWSKQEDKYFEIKGDYIALRCKEYWSFMYLEYTEANLKMIIELSKKEPDNGRRQED